MRIDGKAIATTILAEVKTEIATYKTPPTLVAITCAPSFETAKYLEMKKRQATSVGIPLTVLELEQSITTADVITTVKRITEEKTGIVVQLPLPAHIEKEQVIGMVPSLQDPDGFQYGSAPDACLPPVVGAIDEITKHYKINWSGKRVVVVGEGRLVGKPARIYAKEKSSDVISMNENSFDEIVLATADIIITGIGKPHFITANMVKPGVVVFDAGTSEAGGQLQGDVHPDVQFVASFFTPVPGGIGPITIAYLLKNLVFLARQWSQ